MQTTMEPPQAFVCPITYEVMEVPAVAPDGRSYERAAIEAWLRNHDTSPATGKPLPSKKLVPNVRARSMLRELPELTAQSAASLGLPEMPDDLSETSDASAPRGRASKGGSATPKPNPSPSPNPALTLTLALTVR